LFTVQRVLKTYWNSRRLDWTRLGRCEHLVTLESDRTGLDLTRLFWCVCTLTFRVTQRRDACHVTNVLEQSCDNCIICPSLWHVHTGKWTNMMQPFATNMNWKMMHKLLQNLVS